MAKYTIIKFKNLTPLHMGTGRESYDFSASELHSDTLSAAMASIRSQNGKTNDVVDFLKSFTISSAFPYMGNSLFLPKPQGRIDVKVSDMDEYPSRKKLKKIKYMESSLWCKLVMGKELIVTSNQIKGSFLLSEENHENFVDPSKSQVNQRVTVPRCDNVPAEPFFFEWKYYNNNAGLYCILDAPDELMGELVSLLKQLGEIGLGTDRNVGGGKFEVDEKLEFIELPELEQTKGQMLLSLYIPTEEELAAINLSGSRYETLLRGGYIAGSEEATFRHLRKKSIYMFNVGSVFDTQASLSGKVVDLKPEWNGMHSVFRSGKPFVVPVNI